MVRHRSSAAWVAVLLLIPLVGITAWLVHSALNPEPLQVPVLAPPDPRSTPSAPTPTANASLPDPQDSFPPERLFERVDGAADFLISLGCEKLSFWRLEDPPADLEILFFSSGEGAGKALAQDAGSDRTPGPGDEAFVAAESVFFRRGRAYTRLIGDPGAVRAEALAAAARRADEWIQQQGGIRL